MSAIPLKGLAASSAVGSALLVRYLAPAQFQSYIGTFTLLIALELLLFTIWKILIFPNYVSPLRHLPGPKTGNSLFMGQAKRIIAEASGAPIEDWANTIPNDGLIRYLGFFNVERLVPTNPKTLSEVLVTKNYDFIKPWTVRTGIGRVLGIGVLLAEGEEHKRQRKILMPAFSYRAVKDLTPTFWQKSCELVEAMTEELHAKAVALQTAPETVPPPKSNPSAALTETTIPSIEVATWASRGTLDIIGVAGMGYDFNAIKDPNTALAITYRQVFVPSPGARLLGLLNLFLPAWLVRNLPLKRNGEIEAAALVIRTVCRNLIANKRAKLAEGKDSGKDILAVALQSGGFQDEEVVDQLMTFLAAGHETTATALTWAMYLLAKNPNCQAKLREEIHKKLPSPRDKEASIDDRLLDSLPYLNGVIQETLRTHPPVAVTIRITAKATTIGNQAIPEGTTVFIVPQAINRSKALWGDDAAEFKPERWVGDKRAGNGGAESNFAMLTFLHGPRSCIGQAFARAELKAMLSVLVGRMEFWMDDPDREVVVKGGVTSRLHGGLEVRAKVMESW